MTNSPRAFIRGTTMSFVPVKPHLATDDSAVRRMQNKKRTLLLVAMLTLIVTARSFGDEFSKDIQPLLKTFCFDCHHNADQPEGGVNLAQFTSDADVLRERAVWKEVFNKLESRQMPPPKHDPLPSEKERQRLLDWISEVAARPNPALNARDPGKPVIRRLTRLEYNNTVRDLLELETDVFMFSERLPLADRTYWRTALTAGRMGDAVEIRLREYGTKYPVLLPQHGLPADGRAEHGFRNRGEMMNVSPLSLEQYVAMAGAIVNHQELPQRSRVFAELLGLEFRPTPLTTPGAKSIRVLQSPVVAEFAPEARSLPKVAGGADNVVQRFREEVADAFQQGRGGVMDVAKSIANTTLAGKGAVLRVPFGNAGSKTLLVNPDQDLWFAPFGTAEETSGSLLFTGRNKGEKRFELSFAIKDGDEDEAVSRLAVCVLGRERQSGNVTLTARCSDGTETELRADIAEGATGTTVFTFAAVPGESIRSVLVDGSRFSGDYVLLDDLGFITTGKPFPNAAPPQAADPSEKTNLLSEKPGPAPAASKRPPLERLAQFVERALRRPARPDEQARYQSLFQSSITGGQSEADAMRLAVQAVLASPSFLFLSEEDRPEDGDVRPLDDYELANRLSYFLWSSTPDDELLTAAKAGRLQETKTLESQIRRMLRDPRACELSESFAVQWLRLDQLYTAKPDPELFKSFYSGPQGKDTLHGAQLVEALLLFETALIENRSVLEFIAADYTWLNPRLAKVYGLDLSAPDSSPSVPVNGQSNRELRTADRNANNHWQRVPLKDISRGGFLTMSGPLTITSLPFRTSPVKRGAWILETIFNRPPTEPKVAFTIENDTKQAAAIQSTRQKFESHRNNASCYSCHIRIDPPGFAMEAFDPIGVARTQDGGQPVDTHSEWNNHSFNGPAEFKRLLQESPHEFTRGFIEHLLSYALCRALEIYDQPTIQQIEETARDSDFRLHQIITAIATSYPFRHTRADR